ncbi:MAG: UbiH/UbiF family hydroxylase [Rhizobiaceae bacterium]
MTASKNKQNHAISIVGGGLVGKVAALELAAQASHPVALIAPDPTITDKRTTAMLMPAIEMLQKLGLWADIEPLTAPLKTMRLIDGSKRLIRAPVTDFHAGEIDLPAFGYNVPNADMLQALDTAIEANEKIIWHRASADNVQINASGAKIQLSDGNAIETQLIVAADGQHSTCREAAGINRTKWSYPQSAIVLNFAHDLPHSGVSAEFHTETGPFTQVPLPATKSAKNRSSLVWLVEPNMADELVTTELSELSRLIEEKLQSSYGKCRVENAPTAISMHGMTAQRFGANRTVLIGESGHLFPPIGAQGFNLGLRDIRDLTSVLAKGTTDPGAATITEAYDRKRQMDVKARTAGIDVMNRSLLTDFLPVQFARSMGLTALGSLSPLRKMAMYQGIGMDSKVASVLTGPGRDLAARFRSQ